MPFRSSSFRRLLLRLANSAGAAVLALVAAPAAARAVAVSPTALYIDARNPVGTLTLINTGTLPEEIEISFAYGYPSSDSLGNITVQLTDTAASGEPSLVSWMRAFPRRLVLAPGQRQTLRVMVTAPAGLADGEYWGRVLVRSRGGQPPIEQRQGDVSMQVNVETTVATAVFFRRGVPTTGVTVAPSVRTVADSVHFIADLTRTGNSAWLGRIRVELLSPGGNVVASVEDVSAVYRAVRRRFTFPLPATGPRTGWSIRYVADNERPDLPPNGPSKGPPVAGTVAVP